MAQITPQQILTLSEPVEQIYSNVVDALLVNLAKHLKSGKALATEQWELQKLSELGQLTQESVEIIANLTGLAPEEIQKAIENAALWATEDVEQALQEGVEKGAVTAPPSQGVLASESVMQALQALEAQAVDKTNLVNTNMLQSTLAQYRKVVANTAHIERQMRAVQQTLDTQAARVATGTATRTQALREALGQIHKEGITGFYDKAGRKWTPEAYVNMTVRTTVHNTAIGAVKIRQEDYGAEIFQVSRHSGARPLCYPYQGRFFTWNNSGGTFTDGEGKRRRYAPVSSTSYGKPAGLFGINCGHHPIPVIPGVTIPRERAKQNKEQNDRAYALSQKQRALERSIRYTKQRAAMMEAAGDMEGFAALSVRIKEKQGKYNAFCKMTGRTKRTDRTQVFEYNKNVSSKANLASKKYGFYVGRSVGAKSKNYDILDPSTGEYFHFAEGTYIQDIKVFAGKGTKHPLHPGVGEGLAEQLGGSPDKWQHVKGHGMIDYYGEERPAEVHWFQEESVGKVKFRVKRWEDES